LADKKAENNAGYKIGQIVYILSGKGQAIIPAMIVEQMTVQTLDGVRVSWKLAIGAKNNPNKPQQVVESDNINGEIFGSLEAVKTALETKLKNFIASITRDAKKRTQVWYGSQIKNAAAKKAAAANPASPAANGKIDPEDLLQDLETDGSLVEQGMSHVASPVEDQTNLSPEEQKANLQNRLKDMATMTDEELEEDPANKSGDNSTPMGHITGPDGTKIPVNLKL